MPAPRADFDESGLCTRIAIKGIRQTARETGLPVTTVHDIAKRNGVQLPEHKGNSRRTLPPVSVPRTESERPAHAVITEQMASLSAESRLSAARIGALGLAEIASRRPAAMLRLTQEAANLATLMVRSNQEGWERKEQIETRSGDAIPAGDLERLLAAALARLPELEAEVQRLDQA